MFVLKTVTASTRQVINYGLLNRIYFCASALKCAVRKQVELGAQSFVFSPPSCPALGLEGFAKPVQNARLQTLLCSGNLVPWNSLLPGILHKYALFPTVFVFFLWKPLCGALSFLRHKENKTISGKGKAVLSDVMYCFLYQDPLRNTGI